eukprot:777804_1
MIISITSMALSTDLTTRLSIESVKLMNSIPYSYTQMFVEDTTAQKIPHQTIFNTLDAQHPLIQSIDKSDKTAQHNTIHSFNHQIRSDRLQSDFHTSHIYTNNTKCILYRGSPSTEPHIPRR